MSKEDISHLTEDLNDPVIQYERDGGWPLFLICATRDENGYIQEVFLDPRYQKDNDVIYRYEVQGDQKDLRFETWEHKGFEPPKVSYNGWCSDHECVMSWVYTPRRTKLVRIKEYSMGVHLYFQKEDAFE